MGISCAPLVADLCLVCFERNFMLSLSDNNQADVVEAFKSTSIYLDDLPPPGFTCWISFAPVFSLIYC